MATTPTPTVFHLIAVTDDSISKVHLGARERPPGKSWCGVQLLVPGDTRFSGRYAGVEFTSTGDLATVTCRACQRTAAWTRRKGSTYTITPAPKASR